MNQMINVGEFQFNLMRLVNQFDHIYLAMSTGNDLLGHPLLAACNTHHHREQRPGHSENGIVDAKEAIVLPLESIFVGEVPCGYFGIYRI